MRAGNGHISNLGYGMQVIPGRLSLAVVPVAFAARFLVVNLLSRRAITVASGCEKHELLDLRRGCRNP